MKSLAWLYACGGEPFPISAPPRENDLQYQEQLHGIFEHLSELDWRLDQDEAPEAITDAMRNLRASDLARRKSAYQTWRIDDQHRYYTQKSGANHKLNAKWTMFTLVITFVGLVFGVVRIVGDYETDLLGLAAVGAAWVPRRRSTRQFRSLATSYAATANELEAISINVPYIDTEQEWSTFVRDAERAVEWAFDLADPSRHPAGLRLLSQRDDGQPGVVLVIESVGSQTERVDRGRDRPRRVRHARPDRLPPDRP